MCKSFPAVEPVNPNFEGLDTFKGDWYMTSKWPHESLDFSDKKVGIIGYPLGHSLSPIFQQAAFDDLDINIVYESWPLKLEQIPNFVQDFKFHSVLGMNVTIPYKEIIIDSDKPEELKTGLDEVFEDNPSEGLQL